MSAERSPQAKRVQSLFHNLSRGDLPRRVRTLLGRGSALRRLDLLYNQAVRPR